MKDKSGKTLMDFVKSPITDEQSNPPPTKESRDDVVEQTRPPSLEAEVSAGEQIFSTSNKEIISLTDPPSPSTYNDWLFITNQVNMMMILAAGLIMPPQGFHEEYFNDLLSRYPGWVPLFSKRMPQNLVNEAISETSFLKPTIAAMDISHLHCNAKAISKSGELRDISLPDDLSINDFMLLVPAPISTSFIQTIFFRHVDDKKDFLKHAKIYKNVPLGGLKTGVKKKLFDLHEIDLFDSTKISPLAKISINHCQAVGAIYAILFHLANRSDLGCSFYRLISNRSEKAEPSSFDPILQYLPHFLDTVSLTSDSTDIQVRLFWTIVENIILPPHTSYSSYDIVINVLDKELELLGSTDKEEHLRRLQTLIKDLRGIRSLSSDTPTSLFEKHKKSFSRSLILFFLREDCRGLLEFTAPELNDTDYLVTAILFGAREKWINLPLDMRLSYNREFSNDIAYKMAKYAHQEVNLNLTLDSPPNPTIPLRELFNFDNAENKVSQKKRGKMMLEIARQMNWECIDTVISLEKGEYQLLIDQQGTRLVLKGDLKPVNITVDKEAFYENFNKTWLPEKVEQKAREISN